MNFKNRQNKFNVISRGLYLSVAILFCANLFQLKAADKLELQYLFDKVSSDQSQVMNNGSAEYTASLQNGATVVTMGDYSVLSLGSANGYLDFTASVGTLISTLSDFSISTYLYIDEETDLSSNGNFVWTFGNSNNMNNARNGCMFFHANSTRYTISLTDWSKEQSVRYNSAFDKGEWHHILYSQSGTNGILYLDGVEVKNGTIDSSPKDLGSTGFNYIGKSSYNGDAYLKNSMLTDFRIYSKALTPVEASEVASNLSSISSAYAAYRLSDIIASIQMPPLTAVISNLELPTSATGGVLISWESSNLTYLSNNGVVTRPALGTGSVDVTLTGVFSVNGSQKRRDFTVTILPELDDATAVANDANKISIAGNLDNLRTNLTLPLKGEEGTTITWASGNTDYLLNNGTFVKLSPAGAGKQNVELVATVTRGSASVNKVFAISIAEDEGTSAYLFAYFTGNSGNEEAIRFALSNDGYNYRALNDNQPIISSAAISLTGGVRDPHIYRAPDGNFYMVVTDMVSALGWASNRGMVLLKSPNLVDWTSATVHIPTAFPNTFSDVTRVWAPQVIYDETAGKLMLYFSMLQPGGYDIIYYAYANQDFTALEGTPKQLFYSPTNNACIDGDIIFEDGKYNLFFKTEGNGNGIKKAVSTSLTEGYVLLDKYLDQSSNGVEGSSVFKLINSDTYILMYDVYTAGRYEFTESEDLENFSIINNEISMNFFPRHGTVMAITAAEAKALADKWGTASELYVHSVEGDMVKTKNVIIDNSAKTLYIPVKYGTDITSFIPEIKSLPGATITPSAEADFSNGPVEYTISLSNGASVKYQVTVKVDNNPVLEGYYADPEILYSNKTGKFYLYPTSDGFTGWSGSYFKTFSSPDLVNWTDEGVILDFATDVSWATSRAWAPTIIEREVNGAYKYFYYFSAEAKIGVAVSDNPTGPFIDSGEALISSLPAGANGGQQIDPDVFRDPQTDKYYLYYGNGYMACVELNDDMVSVKTETTVLLTPNSTYREGTEVIYRDGTYYFLWSEDDTRSENYRVRYATSTSATGPLTIPTSNMVIKKDAANAIYATGHNSVIQVPGKDEWYIVYHRFSRPEGITLGDAAGYFREVCIDKLTFDKSGAIIEVVPTTEGISPVKLNTSLKNRSKKNDKLTITPNPATNKISVQCSTLLSSEVEINIYDLSGKQMMQVLHVNTNTEIDTSDLKANIYLVTCKVGNTLVGSDQLVIL